MLAPGREQEPGPQGVVELPPGVVQRRGADAQPVGAQDPDGDAEQEEQFDRAVGGARFDAGGAGGGRGVVAGELAVGATVASGVSGTGLQVLVFGQDGDADGPSFPGQEGQRQAARRRAGVGHAPNTGGSRRLSG